MLSRRQSKEEGHNRKFLAILDDTPECERAVLYAAKRAKATNGALTLLYVVANEQFQHWIGVQEVMTAEAMEEAQNKLTRVSAELREKIDINCETVCKQGDMVSEINLLIEEDKDIVLLVLAASSAIDEPGPLVSSIAGRSATFPIPVTIIPGELSDEDMLALC